MAASELGGVTARFREARYHYRGRRIATLVTRKHGNDKASNLRVSTKDISQRYLSRCFSNYRANDITTRTTRNMPNNGQKEASLFALRKFDRSTRGIQFLKPGDADAFSLSSLFSRGRTRLLIPETRTHCAFHLSIAGSLLPFRASALGDRVK